MSEGALTFTETRQILDAIGLRPRKNLGQNFLIDGNIVRKSLELGEVAEGEAIIEVGPGLGTLTGALLEAGCSVFAVEKDPLLYRYLKENLAARFPEKLSLLEADAMAFPLAGFRPNPGQSFKIVANLPYAISSPWMDAVLSGPLPDKMVLMLQQETVDRFSAVSGTKQFGAITIFLKSAFRIAPGHKVSRQCFYPVPDIDSYLFHLTRLPEPFLFTPQRKKLIRACFGQRRKQIGSLLRTLGGDEDFTGWYQKLEEAGYSRQSRPEEIPTILWQEL